MPTQKPLRGHSAAPRASNARSVDRRAKRADGEIKLHNRH